MAGKREEESAEIFSDQLLLPEMFLSPILENVVYYRP